MKLLLIAAALLVASPVFSQATLDRASKEARNGSSQPENPVMSTLARGIIAGNNSLVVSAWGGSLVFEGATNDAFETTFAITDPTADRTITFPNSSGTVALNPAAGDIVFEGATANDFETTLAVTDPTADRTITLPDASGNVYVWENANTKDVNLIFEGATANGFETTVTVTDPTADRTVTVPDKSGTVMLAQAATATAVTADDQAVTPGGNTFLTFTSDDATPANRTITLSATGAVTGQVYVLIGPATNAIQLADSGTAALSAAWEPGANDTLTLVFDGTNFVELARSAN